MTVSRDIEADYARWLAEDPQEEEKRRQRREELERGVRMPAVTKTGAPSVGAAIVGATGDAITTVLKGVTMPGQGVLAFFRTLQDQYSSGNRDDDFGVERFGNALQASVAQMQRVWSSDNLTELGENYISGADILMNMPGAMGETFRDDSVGGKIATAALGFGLEMLLDPAGLLGRGGKVAAKAAMQGVDIPRLGVSTPSLAQGVETLTRGAVSAEGASRVAQNLGGSLAQGNIIAGPIATGVRTTAATMINIMKKRAEYEFTTSGTDRYAKAIELLVSPLALASTAASRRVIGALPGLLANMPRETQMVAKYSNAIVAAAPPKVKQQVQVKLTELGQTAITNQERHREVWYELMELGVSEKQMGRIVNGTRQGFERLAEVMALSGLDINLQKDYVPVMYKMFSTPEARRDQLSWLGRRRAPARVELALGDVGRNLDAAFGTNSPNFWTEAADAADEQGSAVKTFAALESALDNLNARLRANEGTPEAKKILEQIAALENARKMRMTVLQSGSAANAFDMNRLQGAPATRPPIDQNVPTAADAMFPPGQGNILNTEGTNIAPVTGGGRPPGPVAWSPPDGSPVPAAVSLPGDIAPIDKVAVTYGGTTNDIANFAPGQLTKRKVNALANHAKETQEIAKAVGKLVMPQETVTTFKDELAAMLDNVYARGVNVIGETIDMPGRVFKRSTETGLPELAKEARKATATEVMAFTDDFAKRNNLNPEQAAKLKIISLNSISYIPSDKEFAVAWKQMGGGVRGQYLDPSNLRGAEQLTGLNVDAISDITMDPIYHSLMGFVDEFSARVAEGGARQGSLAAQARVMTMLKEVGSLRPPDEAFPGSIPIRPGIPGMEQYENWRIAPGDWYALNAVTKRVEMGQFERIPAMLSGIFKRSQLMAPASVATQYLGNIAMLRAAGYGEVFDKNPIKFYQRLRSTLGHITGMDDVYEEAVEHGVQIDMSVLSDTDRSSLVNQIIVQGQHNSDPQTLVQQAASAYASTLGRFNREGVRNAIAQNADDAMVATNNPALQTATGNFGAMLALPDQMTRMLVYSYERAKIITDLKKQMTDVDPAFGAFFVKTGTEKTAEKVDWKAIATYQENAAKNGAKLLDEGAIRTFRDAQQIRLLEAAEKANDTALNYYDTPGLADIASRYGVIPFIKYQTKAAGRILEWVDEKPAVFIPYVAAQQNLNRTFIPDDESWDRMTASMSPAVRDGFTVLTGTQDRYGRDEAIDFTNWMPFGFLATASGLNAADPTGPQNTLYSIPAAEFLIKLTTNQDLDGRPVRRDNETFTAYAARLLAEMFSPTLTGPGGRRLQMISQALEQDKFVPGEMKDPSPIGKRIDSASGAIGALANLPGEAGAVVDRVLTGTGSAGTVREPALGRPWSTPEQAVSRSVFPGLTFSADPAKAYNETERNFDAQIQQRKAEMGTLSRQIGPGTPENHPSYITLKKLQDEIAALERNRGIALSRYLVGR